VAQKRAKGVDPTWPDGDHPVTETNADVQGALSPFGDVRFPVDSRLIPYVHPVTVINR
jgi:hypothetical protein